MGLQQGHRLVPLIELVRSEAPSGASFVSGVPNVNSVRNILLGGIMRLGNYLRVFSALTFLLLWHSPASAENYYWDHETKSYGKFSSPSAACQARWDDVGSAYVGRSPRGPKMVTQARAICLMDNGSNYGYVSRRGTSCPSGTEYKPETGECIAPVEDKCAVKAGIYEGFSKAGTAPDAFVSIASNGYAIPQRQGCKGGCAVEITDLRGKTKTSGSYYYRGTVVYSGQQCATTGTGDQIDEDTNESTEPETIKEDVPCVYSADGGKQVCESRKSEEMEGQSCGTVNGVPTCIQTLPEKNGIDIRTEVTTETHADGSTTTTKKDTATATTCKGINNCTTKTATTTTTIKKDAGGNTTSTDSKCTGTACGSSFNPDSDGDGLGDCTGDDCGAGGGVEGQDWYTPTGDTFGSVLTEFVGKVQQTPIASQTTSFLTFRAYGSCPRWSVSVWVFDIDIDQLCTGDIPWDAIKAVILAAAGFFAFRIALL